MIMTTAVSPLTPDDDDDGDFMDNDDEDNDKDDFTFDNDNEDNGCTFDMGGGRKTSCAAEMSALMSCFPNVTFMFLNVKTIAMMLIMMMILLMLMTH